jgi:putrescine---pyruvate transaminase
MTPPPDTALTPEALHALDHAHVLHPWTHFGSFARGSGTIMARGEGAFLWDAEGRRYLDAVGGLWCTNIGLGRREVAQAIAAQAERLAYASGFVDMGNDPAARLAGALAARAPGDLNRVHFTTGGSTAVDTAVRMVWYVQSCLGHPEKTGIVARHHSYHGATYLTQSVGNRPGDRCAEFRYKTDGIYHLTAPNPYRRPAGMTVAAFTDMLVAEFEDLIAREGADRIGGFIAEPIQGAGGVIVPPEGYLRRMVEVCRRHGILFIADEVVTGFGRLGHWFASEPVFGVVPDIITTAKGLTSAYVPMGAVIFSDRIWHAMAADPDRWFTSGFTYAGHPVAAAAGLKVIEIIEAEGLLAHAARMGNLFQQALGGLNALPLVGEVRGMGLMACVENVADRATGALLPDEADVGGRIAREAGARGLLVRPIAHLNVMSPPLVVDEAQVAFAAETLGAAIRAVADALAREGYRLD